MATTNILRALAIHWEREQEFALYQVSMERAEDSGLFLRDEIFRYLAGNQRAFTPCDPVRFVPPVEHESEGSQ